MNPKHLIAILIILSIVPLSTAEEITSTPTIPPDNVLYPIKIALEDVQETLTLNDIKRLELRQAHMQNRLNELRYELSSNKSNEKTVTKLIERIQSKQNEIDNKLNTLPVCIKEKSITYTCKFYENDMTFVFRKEPGTKSIRVKHSSEVLNSLLNDPRMPASSRMGMQNAMRVYGNMVQGDYKTQYTSMLPFKFARVYDPNDNTWYSIIVYADSVKITTGELTNVDVVLYPTVSQMNSLNDIIKEINKNGKLSYGNKLKLTMLWYQIKKA